ncbi:MAG: hypothetical protein LAP21_08320 [Acidobacteriia bacterium]|nr:hypothetical protein [Terriglobia bacterium]
MQPKKIHLGYEIGTGKAVSIPLGHLAVTGQTQQSGKTTTLEALTSRAIDRFPALRTVKLLENTDGVTLRAIAFVTKRAESGFSGNCFRLAPFFQSRSDWQFVSDILESKLHEKLKFQRSWIMKVCRGTSSLQEVKTRVQKELSTAKRGLDQSVYTELDAYLDLVIPELEKLPYTEQLTLRPGLNVMDLSGYSTSLQMLVISSVMQHVYEHESGVVTIIPEAWEFVPQKRGSPVMRAAEALIRKSAAAGNYVWLDSQDLAGVHKDILKHCSVWILGVQREENEVQRTLKNVYGLRGNRPQADDIRALGKGEFYACWGSETRRVYVQPVWCDDKAAQMYALRQSTVPIRIGKTLGEYIDDGPVAVAHSTFVPGREEAIVSTPYMPQLYALESHIEQGNVKEALRLVREVRGTLSKQGSPPGAAAGSEVPAAAHPPVQTSAQIHDDETKLFNGLLSRLLQSPGLLLEISALQPEIVVQTRKQVIEIAGDTLRGRLARLIAENFFDAGANGQRAFDECKRRGWSTAKPNVYRELDKLAEMGFLLKEPQGYTKSPAAKVTVKTLEAE